MAPFNATLAAAMAVCASMCGGPPTEVAEVVTYQSGQGELRSVVYLAGQNGAYVRGSGVAEITLAGEAGEVLFKRDEVVDAGRFTSRYNERTGTYSVYYALEPVDLNALEPVVQLNEGDTLRVCVNFEQRNRSTPLAGCEGIYWRARERAH